MAESTRTEGSGLVINEDGRLWFKDHGPMCTVCEDWIPTLPYRYGHSDYEMKLQAHMNQCRNVDSNSARMISADAIRESMERPPQALKAALESVFADEDIKHDCGIHIPQSVLNTINDALHDMQAQAAFDNARGGSLSRKARARDDYRMSTLAIKWLEDFETNGEIKNNSD